MEENKQGNPKNRGNAPPLGALYEGPLVLLDKLRELNEKDPSFVSWVLLRSEQLASLYDTDDGEVNVTDIKAKIAESLVEAYDIHEALMAREKIMEMLGAS